MPTTFTETRYTPSPNAPEVDAGGYMGDWRRGAPMGRPTTQASFQFTVNADAKPFVLRAVRLDSGGYDQGGAYWGYAPRDTLYYWEGPLSDMSGYVRGMGANRREDAKAQVRKLHPLARFYR